MVAIAAGGQPGAFTYIRAQQPGAGAIALAPGARALPSRPNGTASTATFEALRAYRTGEVIQDCPTCPQMVVVPAGTFMMGSPATEEGRQGAEGPRHQVTFKRAFAVGKYEVTFDEWNACVADGDCTYRPADNGWGQGRRPVINVGWTDVREYVGWLTKKSGYYYYLPSESEWEYAARAGADTPWNTGDGIITDDANLLNVFGRTVPVGGFPPNAFGLHDMHGNVAEYVQDCFDVGYFDVPTDGGARLQASCTGIARGGSYRDEPAAARSAARWAAGNLRDSGIGFRVVRLLD
ncbi:MAG: formylglycine-generating enzyme family protein [Phenylobacterium zucineum]|nr:MAG: formylglycine-generating enzyme family protein [Phenylobacterium zucineum]